MAEAADTQTSTTLLRRLREKPRDQAAWGEFAERYGRLIYGWCRHWQLQVTDAEDVTQNVLVELLRQMHTFVYDPSGSFRGWLKTIAYRCYCRLRESRQRAGTSGHDSILELLGSEAAYADFLQQLERESDRELLDKAMALVRLRVQPHTWEAFRQLALESRSGADVAAQLGMKIGAVFVARSKVQKMLREEIQRLGGGERRP